MLVVFSFVFLLMAPTYNNVVYRRCMCLFTGKRTITIAQ